MAGATNSATCVDEPTAISSVTSTLFLIAKKTADACSAALPITGMRMRPTKIGEILSVCKAGLRAETRSSDSRPTSNAAPSKTLPASTLDHSGFSLDVGVRNRCALVNCMKTRADPYNTISVAATPVETTSRSPLETLGAVATSSAGTPSPATARTSDPV